MTTDDALICREDGVVEAQFDEVRVLLNADLDYLGLDGVGQRIWDLLESPRSLGALVSQLTAEYDVAADQCRRDVVVYLDALAEHKLVRRP